LAERAWLKQLPSLSLGVDPSWEPYEYLNDNGDFSGIAADYTNYVKESLSLTIEANKSYSWIESLVAIKNNEIDLMSAIVRTPEREKSMLFTEPYITEAMVLVSRKDGFIADTLDSLKGRSVGVPAGYAQLEFIATDYPEIEIISVESGASALKKLSEGEFDAFMGSISTVNRNINEEGLFDLIITGFLPYKLEVSMAVRKELSPLVGILNKVFLSMSEREKAEIANNWLAIRIQTGTELSTIIAWVFPLITFLLLIIFMFVHMNRRLKVEIEGRKESEEQKVMLASQLSQSQKMEAMGKLTGGIAHDFNNMLGVIIGYSDLLKTASLNEKQLASYADKISTAGKRGAKLTSKLLSFTRTQQIQAVRVDINKLLQDQQDVLQKILTVRVKIILQLSKNVWQIKLDRSDLEDSILNMSINAMHAMKDNLPTAELILKTENIVMTEKCAEELGLVSGNYVKLCIIDNGAGMSEEVRKKIFDPFFSTKGEEGTGLGLSQVFGFMQRSGGGITVTSLVGQGARFTLYFPEHIAEPEEELAPLEIKVQSFKGSETILIVDDELALRQLAADLLKREGYNVLVVDCGAAALVVLENEHVDLVLTDVLMPGLDGYQLAVKIEESHPKIKIRLVSGFADDKNIGAVDSDLQRSLINKPYSRVELLRSVRASLDS
jgi:signal transduction histidine kinase